MTRSKNKIKRFSADEIAFLQKHYPDEVTADVARQLNRSVSSINAKCFLLKIKKSEKFIEEQLGRFREGGKQMRFAKGNKSWNKGKKLEGLIPAASIEGMKKTQFKKGDLPHNTRSDGEISIRKDKSGRSYKFIRKGLANWPMLHVVMWEEKYGKVPEGMIVVFKNKNTLDCRLENLELISRRENMLRNSIQNYPGEVKETIFLIKKLNRYINGKEQDY